MPALESVTAGGAHFVLLSSHQPSPIYVTGDHRYGQLGDIECTGNCPSMTLHELQFFSRSEGFPSSIRQVACGQRHSLALTTDGDVYIWGWTPYFSDVWQPPTPVDLGENVIDIPITSMAAATDASVFLLADGTVWQLGTFSGKTPPSPSPVQQVPLPHPARSLGAAQWSFYAVLHE